MDRHDFQLVGVGVRRRVLSSEEGGAKHARLAAGRGWRSGVEGQITPLM